jgi:hypothetical protein
MQLYSGPEGMCIKARVVTLLAYCRNWDMDYVFRINASEQNSSVCRDIFFMTGQCST